MHIRQFIFLSISFFSVFSYNTRSLQSDIIMRENPSTETAYEYGDDGRVKEVHHEDGTVEMYEYDKNGNLIQITVRMEDSSESGNPSGEDTTRQDATTENPLESNTGNENPSGDNANITNETSLGDNADITNETPSGESSDTTYENPSGENAEKADAKVNDTGDNAYIEIYFLVGFVAAFLLNVMGKNRKWGGKV